MPFRSALLALILGIGMTGCSTAGKVSVEPVIVRPLVDPAPIAVGIFFAEDLRDHECTGDEGYIAYSWTFALGPPSIESFSEIFRTLFEEVELRSSSSLKINLSRLSPKGTLPPLSDEI